MNVAAGLLEEEELETFIDSGSNSMRKRKLSMDNEDSGALDSVVDAEEGINGLNKNNVVVVSGARSKKSNTYAAKKSVAQGMMDIALITANANQLRYLIEFQRNSPTFYINLILIIISLVLQVAVGVSLVFKGRYDLKGEEKLLHANRMNNFVVVGVFLVTIINVFIASFSITGDVPYVPPPKLPVGT